MRLDKRSSTIVLAGFLALGVIALAVLRLPARHVLAQSNDINKDPVAQNAAKLIDEGRQTFRFDTFGDEDFWGGTLQLHQTINQLSPTAALGLGLKVDMDALPQSLVEQIKVGHVDLNNPATTIALLKLNAVIGVKGFFSSQGGLTSVGITCALCHSTVDNAFTTGIGHRLDGFPNRDLNVGAVINSAPNLQPVADLLGVPLSTVHNVLMSWGPGKFDAELFLDGKAFNPQQVTDGNTTGTNISGATLIPPALGLEGVTLHTWTGWGSVPYWNAFVAILEMHGKGRFWDPRISNATQFPIAAAHGFNDLPHISPDDDRVTSKLGALQVYQLSLPTPQPPAGSFDAQAAKRGDDLFSGKAKCNNCHVEPLWTDAGWNAHKPSEVCIDSFQADRAPDHVYRTSPIGGLFIHMKGGFYHDGRFATLMDVVNHYNVCMNLGLTDTEKSDLIEYLKSLSANSEPNL